MGQQQLLLIILGAIIVAIAVVVGLNLMSSASNQANLDAVRQDLLTIASSAQGWYGKPTMMEGGGNTFNAGDNNGIDFGEISFPADSIDATQGQWAENQNGRYTINSVSQDSFVVDAVPSSDATVTIRATITQGNVAIATQ